MDDRTRLHDLIEQNRHYLRMLARIQNSAHVPAKIDDSDIVQQTMLDAFCSLEMFRGTSEAELRAWLRRMLSRNLADAIRHVHRDKRNVNLEKSLHDALEHSSDCLERYLAEDASRPDQLAQRNELLERLTVALDSLPADQRQAVILHHLQGEKSAEIARRMDKTVIAVAGLIRRGVKRLRELMH